MQLDAEGITVIRESGRSVGPWARVHAVVISGARLALQPGGGRTSTFTVNLDARSNVVSGAWPRLLRIDYPAVPGPTASKLCSQWF